KVQNKSNVGIGVCRSRKYHSFNIPISLLDFVGCSIRLLPSSVKDTSIHQSSIYRLDFDKFYPTLEDRESSHLENNQKESSLMRAIIIPKFWFVNNPFTMTIENQPKYQSLNSVRPTTS